ncbi:MAG: amino acid permease, partial [Thermodesulfobacteriota bacterium]|nr:amino acid permease [Thermodesulfobacteriota bacterium]
MGDNNQAHLKKVLSKWDLLSIGIGAVVGWSWIIYAGIWSSAPGSMGGVIAFVLGGILCSFLGLVYAELTSAMPKAGGDMIFVFEGLGQGWSFIASICITMAFVGLIAVETIMLPVILDALGIPIAKAFELFTFMGESVYLSYILLSVAVNAFFAYLNYRGVALSGI